MCYDKLKEHYDWRVGYSHHLENDRIELNFEYYEAKQKIKSLLDEIESLKPKDETD